MTKNLDSRLPAVPALPRRPRVAVLLNTPVLLATTAYIAAAVPKLPPYRGD